MDKRKESIADIVAEMRMGSPVKPGAYKIGLPDEITVLESGNKMRTIQIKTVTVKELADRIEAAAKREKAQPGNAAAMREALGDVYNILEKIQSFTPHLSDVSLMREFRSRVCRAKKVIDIALSAPPRNCDRYDDEVSATQAFMEAMPHNCYAWSCADLLHWMLDSCKKGETDGR